MFWLYKTTHQNLVIFVEISINVDKKRSNSRPNQSVGVKKTALTNTFAKISIWSLWQNSCGSATLFARQVDHSVTSPYLQHWHWRTDDDKSDEMRMFDLMVSLWLAFQFFPFFLVTYTGDIVARNNTVSKQDSTTVWPYQQYINPSSLGCKPSPCYS